MNNQTVEELVEQCRQTNGISSVTVDISVEVSVDKNIKEKTFTQVRNRAVDEDDVMELADDSWSFLSEYDDTHGSVTDRFSKIKTINVSTD